MEQVRTLANGCTVEHSIEEALPGQPIRVTVRHPDGGLSVTAVRPHHYIGSDHYHQGIQEQADGLLLHGTNPLVLNDEPTEEGV